MAAITICSDFGAPPKIKSETVSTVSLSISHEAMGPDAREKVLWDYANKISYFLSYFLPLILASIDDTCLQQLLQLLLCCLPNFHFSISTIPSSTFTLWDSNIHIIFSVLLTCPHHFFITSLHFTTTRCFRPISSFLVFTLEFLIKYQWIIFLQSDI